MLKIYGHPATSARRCYWLLEELGLEYSKEAVDMRQGEHKAPAFMARNPNGKVPVLEHNGLTLWESQAINWYLAAQFRPEWLGKDLPEQALIQQWSTWSMAEFQIPMIDLFIQLKFLPEEKRDHKVIEKAVEGVNKSNKILDEHLQKNQFMVGSAFSLADLQVASVYKINSAVNVDTGDLAAVSKWFQSITERPAYQRVEKMVAAGRS